ncbi:hypothetical protein ACFU8W_23695 [Streptomyces sp. NPDC057565]|uniref:hypothetical protein n=1 Tax=Streptomyces sp. NPDC057565 TaxID=3346169 RepID=UPI0036BCB74F
MVGVLIRMKLAVQRNSLTRATAARMIVGGAAGLALAAAVLFLAGRGYPHAAQRVDLLGAALAVWTAGWLLGPVLFGGGDTTLRPEHFALHALRPRALATGLAAAAFVGVAPAVTLIALSGLVVVAVHLGPAAVAVAAPATVLQLAFTVLCSRLVTAVLGKVARSRTGAALAAFTSSAILAALHSGWILDPLVRAALDDGLPRPAAAWLRGLPSGWGLSAVEAAGRGDRPGMLAALAGLALLTAACAYGWAHLTQRQVTTRPSGGRAATATLGRWARGPVTAVAARELRTCTRDLQRFHFVCFALGYALVFCLLPLAAGSTDFLPWTGLVFALWMSAVSANLYGEDGTELWGKIMIPGAARHDVRGRQLGWLLVTAPPTVLLTLVPAALSGGSAPWLWLVTFVPALLGGAAGVTVLVSVLRPVPLRDPHRRTGGLLENGTDFTQVLLMLLLTAATAAPALLAVRFGPAWAGPVAGPVSGALLTWLLGRVAVIRLRRTAPELLQHFRTGTPPARRRRVRAAPPPLVPAGLPALRRPAPVLARLGLDTAPVGQRIYVVVGMTLCWVPLVAQGVVPAVMLATGHAHRSWFLALYLPPALRRPAITAMIALGLALLITSLGTGLYHLARSRHRR